MRQGLRSPENQMKYLILTAVVLAAPTFADSVIPELSPIVVIAATDEHAHTRAHHVPEALEHVDRIDLALRPRPTLRPQLAIDPEPMAYGVQVEIHAGRDISIPINYRWNHAN